MTNEFRVDPNLTPTQNNAIRYFSYNYYFLSNFYLLAHPILVEGIYFDTVENAYQAQKCKDTTKRIQFASIGPSEAKTMGRKVACRVDWDDIKEALMYKLLVLKFQNNSDLLAKLIATGNMDLIEGNNWHDNFWGDCDCKKCAKIEGLNNLGKMLKMIREIAKTGKI